MCASGLEEVLSSMYGSNTVQHVLSGKAYVHFLVHGALTYTVSQKTRHQTLGHNFTNYYTIFKIISLADLIVNLQQIHV